MGASQVGLKNLYYAFLLTDDVSGATYGTPVKLSQAINAKISSKASSSTLYADDGAVDTATTRGETEIELNTKDLSIADSAALLGHTISGGVVIEKTTDIAPFVAVGFESVKSNGKKRFVWLFKGKFMVPDEDYKTKADKVDFQTPTIKGVFVKRDFDDAIRKVADAEDPDYISSVGDNWFAAVQGAADTTAPTISGVVPANNATAIAVGATVAWTFSEAIAASSVTPANFAVVNDATGANIAGALTINPARTIVTFTPGANLTAATAYRAIVTPGVKDLAGNALAAPSVTKFTTA